MQEDIVGSITLAWPLKPETGVFRSLLLSNTWLLLVYTFRASVDQWLETLHVVMVNYAHERSVDPTPRLDTVQTTNYQFELHIVVLVFILDFSIIGSNLHAFDPLLNKSSCHFRFRLSYISLPK